jgi:hypothetical protein
MGCRVVQNKVKGKLAERKCGVPIGVQQESSRSPMEASVKGFEWRIQKGMEFRVWVMTHSGYIFLGNM